MSENNISHLLQKNQFDKEQELFTKLLDTINSYQNQISLVSALGVLDLCKDELITQNKLK